MPQPGSVPAARTWSSGAPERPGDTMRVPGCLHSPPEWPHSASSPALGPAPAVPGDLRRLGRTPSSGAGFWGRSPCPRDSWPGNTQRPLPPRPSPGGCRRLCRSQSTALLPGVRFAAGCPRLRTLRYSQLAFACSSSHPFRCIASARKPQRKRRRSRRPFPYGLLLIESAQSVPTARCVSGLLPDSGGDGRTASGGIGPGL